eukprot:1181172-Prorocentrum_minimum.AAC.1
MPVLHPRTELARRARVLRSLPPRVVLLRLRAFTSPELDVAIFASGPCDARVHLVATRYRSQAVDCGSELVEVVIVATAGNSRAVRTRRSSGFERARRLRWRRRTNRLRGKSVHLCWRGPIDREERVYTCVGGDQSTERRKECIPVLEGTHLGRTRKTKRRYTWRGDQSTGRKEYIRALLPVLERGDQSTKKRRNERVYNTCVGGDQSTKRRKEHIPVCVGGDQSTKRRKEHIPVLEGTNRPRGGQCIYLCRRGPIDRDRGGRCQIQL